MFLSLRAATLLFLACACMSVAACDESLSGSERWCDGLCSTVFRCGFQPSNCRARCVADRPTLTSLSEAAATSEAACIAKLSCTALNDDEVWRSETRACWEDTRTNVAATDATRAFCDSQARAWFDCGDLYSGDLCAKQYAVWSDLVLDRMAACARTATCATLADCERRAVEGR